VTDSPLDPGRREFFKWMAVGGAAALLPKGLFAAPLPDTGSGLPRLLVVFQRGGCDAASVLVPYSSGDYYRLRPSIAIGRPDPANPKSSERLDDDWALHPALRASLMPLWRRNELLFVPFSGSQDLSRSHFETQERMEEGVGPDAVLGKSDGWLSRLVAEVEANAGISFTATLPTICSGAIDIPNLPLREVPKAPFDGRQSSLLEHLYQKDPLAATVKSGLRMREEIADVFAEEMQAANRQAVSAAGFEQEARRMGSLLRHRYRIGFVDVGGWDTHVNQGAADGALSNQLGNLGRGLAAFRDELGDAWSGTLVVVMTEFGRTFRENGNRGTDHGHGSVAWILGGGLRGGRIAGRRQPVTEKSLLENRDFPVLNEYRSILASVLGRHFGMDRSALTRIFPGAETIEEI